MAFHQFDQYHQGRADHNGRGCGPVVIEIWDDPRGHYSRPKAAWGIVMSGHSVKGRKTPPAPFTGVETGMDEQTDKGHIYALELGGPNVRENIVPQWAFFQEHGSWRQMEVVVAKAAKTETVFYQVDVVYSGGGRRGRYPAKFLVTAYTMSEEDTELYIASPITFKPKVIEYLAHDGKMLNGTEGAAYSGNPDSWRVDTDKMYYAKKGRKTIDVPWM